MTSRTSSAPESLTRLKNLLLTGHPGSGKTTVLERVAEQLGEIRLAGFVTRELREQSQRVGFEAIGLGGHRVILAHVRFQSLVSVGRYGVEPDRLIPLINEEMVRPPGTVDAYVIDEIGKMECHCPQFTDAVSRLLEGPVPVVATIALRGGGFIAEIKERLGVFHCLSRVFASVANQSPQRRVDFGTLSARDNPGTAAGSALVPKQALYINELKCTQ